VFAALGLTVGVVQGGDDAAARREVYMADVTSVTKKEVAFDYLKDGVASVNPRNGARHACPPPWTRRATR
jgi:preprotein translocase subunit SecA